MLGLTALEVVEQYASLQILTQAELNFAMESIETWSDTLELDIAQFAQDVFGNTYTFNGDGVQTLVTPLVNLMAQLAIDNVFLGSITFDGTVAFNQPVTSTSTFSSSGQYRVRAYRSTSNQAVADVTATAISFAAESYDVGSMHDTTINPSRILIPSGGAGIYSFQGQITFFANATGRREAMIYKNGIEISRFTASTASAGFNSSVQVSCHDVAGPNDYYELFAFQSSGGNLDVVLGDKVTFFSCMKVW